MSYEEGQRHLQKLWQDILSDEEDERFDESSDEYLPSHDESSSDGSDIYSLKRRQAFVSKSRSQKCMESSDSVGLVAAVSTSGEVNTIPQRSIDLEMETIEEVIQNYTADYDTNENEIPEQNITGLVWQQVTGENLKHISFTKHDAGINPQLYGTHYNRPPIDFYELFLDDNILNLMVVETNRYAAQYKSQESAPKARIHKWHDTNIEEMKKFIGILFWMGLCQFPSIESYWSKDPIYYNKIKFMMSRNRFQLVLRMWHFHDNEVVSENRLQKIMPLLERLIENFEVPVIPKESICIDETLVPFRGRLKFRQYIKNKRHKFGIKLYKLCLEKGYTYNIQVYCGQDKIEGQSSSQNVVLVLAKNLLNQGRTIYTDNYYTSVALAHELLEKQTNLVGTLRTNRKLNPKEVTEKSLKKGETVAAESNTGIVIQKWKDKRDVLTLSTKHTSEMLKVRHGDKEIEKPSCIVDYNKHKAYIDLSDQMKSYNTSLRRGVKWYRKLAIELLTGSVLVNAYILHQEVTNDKMSITKFKEMVASKLLNLQSENNIQEIAATQHILEDAGRKYRGRCANCYEKLTEEFGRIHAQAKSPRTKLRCLQCMKNYCMPCFFEVHNCTK